MTSPRFKTIAFRIAIFLSVLVVVFVAVDRQQIRKKFGHGVHAQSDIMMAELANPNGGMGQYGVAMQNSNSYSACLQAINSWNSYVQGRSNWWLSPTTVNRLAPADWNAHQAGAATITAQQLTDAANHLIAIKLAAMTADQQVALYNQMWTEVTPNGGTYSPNSGQKYVTVSQNLDGTYSVVVASGAFADRKAFFQQEYQGMVSAGPNFYPAEAVFIFYSVVAGDGGWANDSMQRFKTNLASTTGLDMTNKSLFGDQGYLVRRPLSRFCDAAGISQLFTDLGF